MRDPNTAFTNTNGVPFPNTEAINASGPSTTDGTEFVKIGIDDGMDWGAAQALLDAADLTPNGLIESVANSQKLQAMNILFGIPRGYISGLIPSNAADADHDITFSIGEARSALASSLARIALTAALTKQIDIDWVAGDNAGGFPSGLTLAVDTWYHLFVIKNTTSKVVDAGFDTSLVAANLLSDAAGYTEFRRVGSVLTDGSSNIIAFKMYEIGGARRTIWDVAVSEYTSLDPGTAAVLRAMTVPLGVEVKVLHTVEIVDSTPTAPTFCLITHPDQTDTTPSASASTFNNRSNTEQSQVKSEFLTNTSQQIRTRISFSAADVSLIGFTEGWEE